MSRCFTLALLFATLPLFAAAAPSRAADEPGFEPIFDGKSLDGWDGNPEFWKVADGAITGQTTAERPTKGNTFIIWRKGETADFELKLQYKIVANNTKGFANSGIQYRSFEVANQKWAVGGYQADFEAGDTYSGINYGEQFRGILANRGQQTVLKRSGDKFEVEVVGNVGESKEIQTKIKKEDWNEYHIIAKGFTFEHRINGVVTSICTDEDEKERRAKGILALQLHAGEPMTVQFRNIRIKRMAAPAGAKQSAAGSAKKKVVFVSGNPSHGYGAHEHYAGCVLLAKSLENSGLGIKAEVVKHGWPTDLNVFQGADAIVMYSDGGGGHMVKPHLQEVDELAKKGVGIVCIHYAVEVEKGEPGDRFLDWIGGYFEMNWSVNPHWTGKFAKFPNHPIARGVKPFEINDEWYYHMRFRPNMEGVTPILTDLPPDSTLARPDGPHSGNPDVRKEVAAKQPQHVAWAAERKDGGRGFGFTGGHDHWNWGEPNFRKLVLNAIAWTAKVEVPAGGVDDATVTLEDLETNQDYPQPAGFNRDAIIKDKKLPSKSNKTSAAPTPSGPAAKAIFTSKLITSKTPGHAEAIDVDISGAKQLFLVVTDGGDGFGCDWADWAEPRLVGPAGEKRLTNLKWKSATSDWGQVHVNQNAHGDPLRIAGKPVEYGIGTHANSLIAFDFPAGATTGVTRFQARCGLDNGGTDQGGGGASSVQFLIYTQQPPTIAPSSSGAGPGGNAKSHDAQDAVAGLDVAAGCAATLFAAEPQVLNLTNIDIDHLGRVWAAEVKNYRKFKDSRPEGDRILVLEDTNGDGIADKTTVFYQGRDIDSVHGICVLGNRVIVSANDKVQVFYDDNGDLKYDRKETLFSGIGGTQHDHGIHAFIFGPDGKLYFNFGNEGRQIKDKDGKPIVDTAGNEISDKRRPYQDGMVFRCNLDGSEVETLGWNFRNNWEVTTDSFGTIWQSDNDDDGNQGVRINYVMEFGNYGYKDELTGAGWQQPRENLEKEIPRRHWHLNDPGVVPTLLLTGAGSPTGICMYEGRLLPKVFWDQMIHCDAGPNVVRAYPVTKDGAGYKADTVNVLYGARDNWFRPSDVCVAPDGSLFVADWYDPGVGGHNQQDVDRGRLFRVAPPGVKYTVPKFNFETPEGAVEALKNPCLSVRYMAFAALQKMGSKSEHAIEQLIATAPNPRDKARALWVLAKIPNEGDEAVELALKDKDPDVRIVGLRLARELKLDVIPIVRKLAADAAPEVRRECAIALRHSRSQDASALWADLAAQHDGQDRWYLEALGIGADKQWDACLDAWLKKVGDKWNTPAGRDVIWRSRAKQTPALLAKIIKSDATQEADQPRYFRAFDFLAASPEKEAALKSILE